MTASISLHFVVLCVKTQILRLLELLLELTDKRKRDLDFSPFFADFLAFLRVPKKSVRIISPDFDVSKEPKALSL